MYVTPVIVNPLQRMISVWSRQEAKEMGRLCKDTPLILVNAMIFKGQKWNDCQQSGLEVPRRQTRQVPRTPQILNSLTVE
jgi:hypothetical protein